MLTRKDLNRRWKSSTRFIADIPIEKLPRIDLSGGGKRGTNRYRNEDVEACEQKYLQVETKEATD